MSQVSAMISATLSKVVDIGALRITGSGRRPKEAIGEGDGKVAAFGVWQAL
jgi:hypothetical protein